MGENPFHTVYLHGLVLDPEGVKMSKTKGNVLDPLELIDIYGADALRFALTTGNSPGNNMRLDERKLESSRNFANKLWNSARFVMLNLENATNLDGWHEPQPSHRQDRWIISRLNRVTSEAQLHMEEYQFGEAQRVIHDFLWGEYCDWYIEMAKIRIRSNDGPSPLPYLAYVLERVLRLLHPFMPFVTEEVWQSLCDYLPSEPDRPDALIMAAYPEVDASLFDADAEGEIETVIELIRAIRNLRAEFRIQPNQRLEAVVDSGEIADVARAEEEAIMALARVDPITYSTNEGQATSESVALVLSSGTVNIPLGGLVDLQKERERLSSERSDVDASFDNLSKRLSDDQFLSKAPEEVVERERLRLEGLEERKGRIDEILSRL